MAIPERLSKQDRQEFAEISAYGNAMNLVTAFKPNDGGQVKICSSKKHQIIGAGGNKGGKTYTGVMMGALSSIPEKDIHGKNTGYLILPESMKLAGYTQRRVPAHKIQAWISTYSQPVQQETVQQVVDDVFGPVGGPYLKNKYTEKGCHHWIETEIARIGFKWQTAEHASYTGANLDWVMLDEPHDRKIYYEIVSRLVKTKGRMWTMLTPVIDAKDPDIARKMRYISWMKEELVDAYDRDPKSVPQVDVIYIDIDENPHVDAEFAMEMWASLSAQEKLIRKTGRFLEFLGESAFSEDMLVTLEAYLRDNPGMSQPMCGKLEYDDRETSEEWKIRFVQTTEEFPYDPTSGWIWRIWEEPINPQMGLSPDYAIGADPAEGKKGKDYTAAYVKRCDTGRTVAALHGYLNEIDLARELWLAGNYYCSRTGYVDDPIMGRKRAKLAVESNKQTTLAFLQTGHDELGIGKYGIENLYRQPDKVALDRGLVTPGKQPGWYTSPSSRPVLVASARMMLLAACAAIEADEPCPLVDMGWLREAKTFILSSGGKFEAAPGFFDDRIIADSITNQVVAQIQGRKRIVIPKKKRDISKELWYIDEDGEYVFNPVEAKGRARKKRERKELWI
jgi:hypothetical protein